jgi:hypothetical protein
MRLSMMAQKDAPHLNLIVRHMKTTINHSMYFFGQFTTLFAVFVLTACTTTHIAEYPHEWAKQITITARDCPGLTGIFVNKGEEAKTNRFRYIAPTYLGQILFPKILIERDIDPKWATEVELRQEEDESLSITLWENKKKIFHSTFKKGIDFECSSSYLITKDTYPKFTKFGPGMGKVTTSFGRAQDGSIIVKSDCFVLETMFIVLVGTETTVEWYKFLPYGVSQPYDNK